MINVVSKFPKKSPKKNLVGGAADGDWARFLVFEQGMPLLSSNAWLGRVAPFCDLVALFDGEPVLVEAILVCLHLLGEPKSPLRMVENLEGRQLAVEMSKLTRISPEWCQLVVKQESAVFEDCLLVYKSLGQHKRVTSMAIKVAAFYESTLEKLLATQDPQELKGLVDKDTLGKALEGLSRVTNLYLYLPKQKDASLDKEASNSSLWEELMHDKGLF